MRYSDELEKSVLRAITASPTSDIVFAEEDYRADGHIMVYRDNLSEMLHRRLYRLIVGKIPSGMYLTRTCSSTRCVNPHHYRLTRYARALPDTCPNGHRYTPANTRSTGHARCRTCYENRLARRRKGTLRKGYCKNGHQLTADNVYVSSDADGRQHRRCKTCHLERVRALRAGRKNTTTGENND